MTTPMQAVASATAAIARLYPANEVPIRTDAHDKTLPQVYPYGVYSALLGGGAAYTLDSRHHLRHGLVSVQTFGKTAASAAELMEKVAAALLDKSLDFDGYAPTTPLRAGLDQPAVNRDPDDDGVITVTLPFTFTAAKEA